MNELRVENGDTCYKLIDITSHQPSGKYLYIPQDGDQIIFSVHDTSGREVITQRYICSGNQNASISINTNLPEGEYSYTVKLVTTTGETHTIVKDAKLLIE